MRWVIDTMAVAGIVLAAGGVYLEFGAGYCLVFTGLALAGLAINAARLLNASNSNSTG